MKCPFCGCDDTRVMDSRPAEDGSSIRRRRECTACGKRFSTYERIENFMIMVVKKDNTREPYDRTKVERGILNACHKRPVSAEQITGLLDELENKILNTGEKEVPSSMIGEFIMEKLQELDAVAYVRFASVYREFKDVDTFAKEITKLLKKK